VYAGDHDLKLIDGDHNSQRPEFFLTSVGIFFQNYLVIDSDFKGNSSSMTLKFKLRPMVSQLVMLFITQI